MPVLRDDKTLASGLWLDQGDALDRIERRRQAAEIEGHIADGLKAYSEQGYLRCRLDEVGALAAGIDADLERLWREKPIDLAYQLVGEPASMADAQDRRDRRPPYRIHDLHSHSPAARRLYLHPQVFSWARWIFDRPPLAFRSIYWEFGSRQPVQRDLLHIDAEPPSHLLSAWIALEDIGPKAGPLKVFPGSHRLPFFEFEAGRILIRPGEDYLEAYQFMAAELRRRRMEFEVLTFRAGEALICHPALIYGAQPVRDPVLSRRSFQIFLCPLEDRITRDAAFWKSVRGRFWRRESRLFWAETDRLLEEGGRRGFDNPLKGLHPRGMTLGEKLFRRKPRRSQP